MDMRLISARNVAPESHHNRHTPDHVEWCILKGMTDAEVEAVRPALDVLLAAKRADAPLAERKRRAQELAAVVGPLWVASQPAKPEPEPEPEPVQEAEPARSVHVEPVVLTGLTEVLAHYGATADTLRALAREWHEDGLRCFPGDYGPEYDLTSAVLMFAAGAADMEAAQ